MLKILTKASLIACLAAPLAQAEGRGPGETLFRQYCATCHGVDAKGTGPLTGLITTKVPDLTGLTARSEGKFPMLDVIHVINGQTEVGAHGGPMPVYGAVFDEQAPEGPYGGPLYTRGKILSLAYYLESVQE